MIQSSFQLYRSSKRK